MGYIINNNNAFVSVKLTDYGRMALSNGKLNFNSWAIGDSELDYNREEIVDANQTDVTLSGSSKILQPFDLQPNIKYFISPSNTSTPFQPLNSSNLNVIKAVINNEAAERGFFSATTSGYTTLTSTTYTPYVESIANTNLTGGTTLNLTTTSAITVGDILLLKLTNNTVGTISVTDNIKPIPNLWYKIQSKTSTSVTLDRNLPNYSSSSVNSYIIIYRGGEVYNTISTGTTTAYWDTGTLSFNSLVNVNCKDVPVWNMNNVWCENLAGITGLTGTSIYENYTKFGSYQYLGNKTTFLDYTCDASSSSASTSYCNLQGSSYADQTSKSISIIHYTNNTISNVYGEFFYVDTTNDKIVKIHFPDLMYHRRDFSTGSGTTMGMSFLSSGATQVYSDSNLEYIDLIEDQTLISSGTTPLTIGRVYPQLKMVIIYDDEIVSAISYKSNRNWTLPALSATLNSPSGGTSTGVLDVNETMYITYSLELSGTTGLTTSLPCQNYIKIFNNTSSPKDVQFKISSTDLLPYMRKKESGSYDGYGFYADKFKLVYQIVSDSNTRPDSGSWKSYDFTSTLITSTSNTTIDPKLLEIQSPSSIGFYLDKLKDSGSTVFDITQSLNMATNSSPSSLQFGDERFFYGNLETYIGANIYKTIFDIRVNASQFNETTNPTMDSTNPTTLKVSEIGIYDDNSNLVCIGKLSKPTALSVGTTVVFELSMDF